MARELSPYLKASMNDVDTVFQAFRNSHADDVAAMLTNATMARLLSPETPIGFHVPSEPKQPKRG